MMYYWIIPTWFVSLIAVFFLGYDWRGMKKTIATLEESVKNKVDKPVEEKEPESLIIDPNDPVQEAMWQREQLMKKLNNE